MTIQKFLQSSLTRLAICGLVLASAVPVKADVGDPNGPNNTPENGWSVWQRWEKLRNSDFDFGLSNMDLGAGMELQKICFGEVDTPNTEKRKLETFWYRVSDELGSKGKGEIQYGCWQNGRFKSTITVAAIKDSGTAPAANTTPAPSTTPAASTTPASTTAQASSTGDRCRRVKTPIKNDGLAIRSEPSMNASRIGGVGNGETITLTTSPATTKIVEGRNWLEIEAPLKGWVNNGPPESRGNVIACGS